jgi:hypothetical protein
MKIKTWLLTRLPIGLFLLCGLVVLLIPLRTPFNFFDEGVAVFNATRIMNGDFPYKDFWTVYPPGQSIALAAIFKIFGSSLLVSRLFDTFVRLIIAFSVWLIAKRISTHTLAYFAFFATILMLGYVRSYSYIGWSALALSLITILSFLKFTENSRKYQLLLTGSLIGITSFFRWDFGLYLGVSLVATLILFQRYRVNNDSRHMNRALLPTSEVTILVGSTLAVVIIYYGYFSFESGFSNLWEQVIIFPTTKLHSVRNTTYPSLLSFYPDLINWLQFYFPLIVYSIALSIYAHYIHRKHIILSTSYSGRFVVTILGLLFFAQALSRFDNVHVLPTSLLAILVVFSLLSPDIFNYLSQAIKLVLLLLLTIIVALYVFIPISYISSYLKFFPPMECYSQIKKASCVPLRSDQEQAIEYIMAHTLEGETIFVGNRRHDLIYINDIGFYFLSDRKSPSRYDELHPGVATTLPVQKEIVYDIKTKNVRWIILLNLPESGGLTSSRISYLDDFIQSKYSPVAEFGDYQILKRMTE